MSARQNIPRVLVLGNGIPGVVRTGGSIFYQELCRYYPKGYLSWFGLGDSDSVHLSERSHQLNDALTGVPIAVEQRPQESGGHIPDRLLERLPLLQHLAKATTCVVHCSLRWFEVPQLVTKATAFGRQQNADIVLAWLNSPTMIYMAKAVAAELQVPLITNVQDPPERFILDHRLDGFTRKALLRHFVRAIQSSVRCGTASRGMQVAYKEQYNVDSEILVHGLAPHQWHKPGQHREKGDFVIGFAGNLYARQEWEALLGALSSVGWRIGGRQVRIRVLSPKLNLQGTDATNIEYLGWRSVNETLGLLSETDVNYLPYWFDEQRKLFVEQCFPNKLSTYLASGRPVFYHGPAYASVAEFLTRYPAGYCCHSLESAQIIRGLYRLMTDVQYYKDAVRAGQCALRDELSLGVFLDRFAALLGIDASVFSR